MGSVSQEFFAALHLFMCYGPGMSHAAKKFLEVTNVTYRTRHIQFPGVNNLFHVGGSGIFVKVENIS